MAFPEAPPPPLPQGVAKLGDRSLFAELEAKAYLNHAAISPLSGPVRAQLVHFAESYGKRGVSAFLPWLAQRVRLKERIAGLLGASAHELAFTPGTSHGVMATALCFPWKAGDRIVLFEGEFPANITPWQRAAEHFDLELVWASTEAFEDGVQAGLQALTPLLDGARLVALSAVRFQDGLRLPTEEIGALCHDAGASLFVDAIQAFGVVPLSTAGIDYLACGGHKWLMGPEGTGFLYASDSAPKLVPRYASWLSHEEPVRFLFEGKGHLQADTPLRTSIDFLEVGAVNGMGLAALEVSVALIESLGTDAIFEHVQRYHDAVEPLFIERGFTSLRSRHAPLRSGSLCFEPPSMGAEAIDFMTLAPHFGERGVSLTTPDGRLRIAPHWPNSLDELPVIKAALAAL